MSEDAPMLLRSFDLETHLIQPGLLAPPIVCGSTAGLEGGPEAAELLDRQAAMERARDLLARTDVTIAGANIAFDFGCLAHADAGFLKPIFRAYDECRVWDVQIAQALDAIAGGHLFCEPDGSPLKPEPGKKKARYSLATVVRLQLGREDAKANDTWRLRYAILQHVPMERWPYEAVQYPKDDAWNTVEVAASQLGLCGKPMLRNLQELPMECETAFCLHLGAMWGFTPDAERVEGLARRVHTFHTAYVSRYKALGFIREDDSEDQAAVKRAVALAYGATGKCKVCGGSGKVRKGKQTPCRGVKAKGRFQGCKALLGCVCEGSGYVEKLGNPVICQASEGGCDGTGLDLDTAPMLPRTATGGISKDRDALYESGNDDLQEYGDNEPEKVRTSYLPFLLEGWGAQGKEEAKQLLAHLDAGGHLDPAQAVPVNLRPNVILATLRTSYDGVVQLVPRSCAACMSKPKRPEECTCIRPCLRARAGRLFGSSDYSAGELCTLAQVCLWVCGYSKMAEAINARQDPGALHTALGAKMAGYSEEEGFRLYAAGDATIARMRQASKPFNFGAPGGMGEAKLVLTNRKKSVGTTVGADGRVYAGIRFCILLGGEKACGVEMVTKWKKKDISPTCKRCLECAAQARAAWFEQWPEMKDYFAWVTANIEGSGGEIPFLGPEGVDWEPGEVVRGGVDFCNGANNGFQSLLARGAKASLRALTREAYTDEESPLYKGVVRTILFAHDENFTEGQEETAHLWGPRVAEVMVRELRRYVPDVYCHADTALMRYWYKDAKPKHDETGKLVVWEPK